MPERRLVYLGIRSRTHLAEETGVVEGQKAVWVRCHPFPLSSERRPWAPPPASPCKTPQLLSVPAHPEPWLPGPDQEFGEQLASWRLLLLQAVLWASDFSCTDLAAFPSPGAELLPVEKERPRCQGQELGSREKWNVL